MLLSISQLCIALFAGLLVGWMTPAIMKDTIRMPYEKGIGSGLLGGLIGGLIYGQSTLLPTNGLTFLWGLAGALVLYFLVRIFSKNQRYRSNY